MVALSLEAQRKGYLMPSYLLLDLIFVCYLLLCGVSGQDWSYNYNSDIGPLNWYKKFPTCAGTSQTPIDLGVAEDNADLTPLVFEGYDEILKNPVLVSNGLKAKTMSDSKPSLSGGCLGTDKYEYEEFHFHWGSNDSIGSEHAVNGQFYPMEAHIVHINTKYGNMTEALKHPDGVATLATFYEISNTEDESLSTMIMAVQTASQKELNTVIKVSPSLTLRQLLPKSVSDFYCYRKGSIESPPCPEAVTWTIFKDTHPISKEQIAAFRKLRTIDGSFLLSNYRPLQPLNGRTVYFHGNR